MLKVLDVANGNGLLQGLAINEGKMIDNHITLEIVKGRLYIFYNTPELRLRGKIMEWRMKNPGMVDDSVRVSNPEITEGLQCDS